MLSYYTLVYRNSKEDKFYLAAIEKNVIVASFYETHNDKLREYFLELQDDQIGCVLVESSPLDLEKCDLTAIGHFTINNVEPDTKYVLSDFEPKKLLEISNELYKSIIDKVYEDYKEIGVLEEVI